jgi:sugar (pentulose or hexulose) kinase
MPTSIVDADLILALDIGTTSTRAILFDVVESRYRFLGAGTTPTTANAPVSDISDGWRISLGAG